MLLGTPLCVRNIPLFERLGKLTDNMRELSKKKKTSRKLIETKKTIFFQ